MKLLHQKTTSTFLIICLLGAAYIAAKIANTVAVIGYQAEDAIKLAVAIILCTTGFIRGRDFLQFTRTKSLFAVTALFVIAYHVLQLLKELSVSPGVPLIARDSPVASIFGELLMIGTLCLFLGAILFSVAQINRAQQRLEAGIAERKRSEDLTRIQRDLAVSLGSVDDLQEGLRVCLHAAIDASGLDCGGIYLRDESSGSLDLLCHSSGLSDDFLARTGRFGREALNTQLVMGGRPVYTSLAGAGVPLSETMMRESLLAVAIIPITRRNQVIGCLNIASHSLTDVPAHSRSVLEIIASQIGGTITRLRAEEALRESETRYRSLVEESADAIGIMQEGKLVFLNSTGVRMFGAKTLDDLLGRENEQIIHPDDLEAAMDRILRCRKGQRNVYPAEVRYVRLDGTSFSVEVNGAPVTFAGRPAMQFMARDITERKQAEESLRESEERFRRIFEQGPIGIATSGADFRFLRANAAFCGMMGRTESELTGLTFRDITHPEDLGRDIEPIQRLFRGEIPVYRTEKRYVRKDAEIVWGNMTATVVKDEPGHFQYFIIMVEDITERKRVEEAIRESEARFRSLVESAPEAVFVQSEGRFVYVNSAMVRLVGASGPEELLGREFMERIAPESHEAVRERIRFQRETGNAAPPQEQEYLRLDGTRVPVETTAVAIRYQGSDAHLVFVRDITERQKSEAALRESEERYKALFDRSLDCVFLTDFEGRFLDANKAALELLGYQPEDIATVAFSSLLTEDQLPLAFQTIEEIRTTGYQKNPTEYRLRRKDGGHVLVETQSSLIYRKGKPFAVQGIARDITERRRAEAALWESEARYRSLVEESADGIGIFQDDKVAFINPAGVRMFGAGTKEELLDRKKEQVIYPDDFAVAMDRILRRQKGDQSVYPAEVRYVRLDGTPFTVEVNAAPITFAGKPAMQFMARDITGRRQAEEALRESEQRYREIFENTSDAVFMLDVTNDGHFRYSAWNPTEEKDLGMAAADVIGREPADFLPGDIAKAVSANYRRCVEAGTAMSFEEVLDLPRGRLYSYTTLAPVRDREGRIYRVLGIGHNITARKQAEEALRSSEQKLRDILNGSPVPLFVIDKNHTIIHWNPALEKCSGMSSREMLGTRQHWRAFYDAERPCMADMLVEDDTEGISRWYAGKFRESELVPGAYEATDFFPNMGQDGKWLEFTAVAIRDTAGHVVGALEMLEDITERKRAEEALARSEEKFSRVFRASPAPIAISRLSDGHMVDVNESLAQASGYRHDEILGRTALALGFWPDPKDRERIVQRVAAEGALRNYECRFRTRDGRILITRYSGEVVEIEGEACLLSVFVDVTEQKQAEERLRAHGSQLRVLASELALAEERERRRIAGELHDHACQDLVLARMRLDELLAAMPAAHTEAFRGISSTLNKTIESVRELTFDLSSPTLYKFGLEAALKELLEDKFRPRKDLEYTFSDDHQPKPLTDDVQVLLFQSVREILINILKHARARRISLDIRRTAGSIAIAVTDDGVGFDVDEVFSLPARHRGFGLFNIKERLDYIGGTLGISSQHGEGSRFVLVAPLKIEGHDSGRNHDVGQNSAR